MNGIRSTRTVAALLPLLIAPIAAITVTDQIHAIPDFVRGFVYGISIVLLLGFLVATGIQLGAMRRRAEGRRLDDLEPLKGLPRDEDGQR